MQSLEAELVPGGTREGLSLLLRVNLVTWNGRGQPWTLVPPGRACGDRSGQRGSEMSDEYALQPGRVPHPNEDSSA